MARPDPVGDRCGFRQPLRWGPSIPALALLLPLLALTACGGEGDGAATGAVPAPVSGVDGAVVTPPAAQPKPALGPIAGLTPLPSPQQVIDALGTTPKGHDPFAPAAGGASLPAGFLFTGVIQSGGLTQAIVYLGGTSKTISESVSNNVSTKLKSVDAAEPTTTICVGTRGGCPGGDPQAPPLPPGWSVTGIDLRNGLLSLRQGSLPVTCRLVMPSVRPPYESSILTSSCTGPGVKAATPASVASSSASSPGTADQASTPTNGAQKSP